MAENNRSGISFNITKGVPTNIPTNEDKVAKATIMNPGAAPINMDNMQKVNLEEILPRAKKEEPPTVEDEMMNMLDLAVEKEKASITERHNALFEKQREEYEARMEKEQIESLDKDIEDDDDDLFSDETESSDNNGEVAHDPVIILKFEESTKPTPVHEDEDENPNYVNGGLTSYVEENDVRVDNPNSTNTTEPTIDFEGSIEDEESSDEEETEVDIPDPEVIKNAPIIHEEENSNIPMKDIRIIDNVDNDSLMDEESEDTDDSSEDDDDEELMNSIRDIVKDKITPIKKTFDLSKFSIAKKADNVQKILKLASNTHRVEADWIMYNANRPVSVTGLSGTEIIKLNPSNSTRNRLNTFKDMYRVIYEHIVDANKPDFEVWLKQTKYVDVQHIVYALYMATFNGSNFTTYSCPECKHVFLKEFKFEEMVSYADEKTKDKVRAILKMDTTSPSNDSYEVDMIQISDKLVFGLRTPSIYNTIIETASLSEDFLNNYASFIDTVAYIDSVYYIDEENAQLVPVDTKPVANDIAKTTGRRIKILHSIINNLSSEEYTYLIAKIAEINKKTENNVSYKVPSCTCPKCAKNIEEQTNIDPIYLLFTRHQLGVIRNI